MAKPWFKVSTDKWLDGSTRRELTDPERAKFIDLLALCARYEGKYQSGGINMSVSDLAYFWHQEESEIRPVLVKMEMVGKIKVFEDRIEIVNWQRYNPHHEEIKRETVQDCADLCEDVRTLPKNQNQNQKENKKENQNKKGKFGEFDNVLLTLEEFDKLYEKFGEKVADNWIEKLSAYMRSKGKQYKDHYSTILTWARGEEEKNPKPSKDLTPQEYIEKYAKKVNNDS